MHLSETGVRTSGTPAGFSSTGHSANQQTGSSPSPSFHRPLVRWPIPRDDEFLVVPLGGLGRIGMNWTLYGHSGRWILVDAGIAFPGDTGPEGVDAYVPDPQILAPILKRLDALIVTHAHEDHIGAIHRLWPDAVNCPIYASPYASAAIARRLEEAGTRDRVEIRTFPVGGNFDIGPFNVDTIRMTHSVPEPVALAIRCAAGTVLHTGDWKLDPNPLIGQPTDIEKLRAIGDAGVLAMLCDSTNANKDLPVSSESQVFEAYRSLFLGRRGIVVVAFFASNVARIGSACLAAGISGRKVAIAGRSMRNNREIGETLGMLPMLEGAPWFLSEPSYLQGLDRAETALLCTGTQGEERAALARLARGDFRLPKLTRGDTVVMSARAIPGNEEGIERVMSQLRQRGVETLGAGDLVDGMPLHVSGHAGRGEIRTMHHLIRPRFAIPVHGEDDHLKAHAELALQCGAQAAPILTDGDAVSLSSRGMRILGRVGVPLLALGEDGDYAKTAPMPGRRG